MPGFDNYSDKEQKWGSRGDWLINNGGSGQISYNGYHFPPAINSRVTVVPEYDASERVVKWLTIAIEIRFIMTDPEIAPQNVGAPGTLGQIQYSAMRSLIARLGQPGQALYFDAQGLGARFRVNDQGDQSSIKDLDFGPKPQVTELQPLGGGNAFLVNWLCTTRISPLQDNYRGKFVEFTYNSEINVNTGGYMTRTINGKIEFPGYARTNNSSEQTDREGRDVWKSIGTAGVYAAQEFILKTFPYSPWMERTYNIKLNESKRVMDFTITDVERETDSWYPPGVGHFELKQSLASDFESGFIEWTLTYSGTIEALNSGTSTLQHQHKALAWFWLWKIIKRRRAVFRDYILSLSPEELKKVGTLVNDVFNSTTETDPGKFGPELKRLPWGEQSALSAGNISVLMYPLSINFTDDMYGPGIDFTISYRLYMTSSLLIQGLGMFRAVQADELDGLTKDSWVTYKLANSRTGLNNNFLLGGTAEEEILVDICNPLNEPVPPAEGPSNGNGEPVAVADVLEVTIPETGKDWGHYSCKYAFLEDHRNVKGNVLMPTGTVKNDDVTSDSLKMLSVNKAVDPKELEFNPYSKPMEVDQSSLYKQISAQVNTPTESTRYVIMQGSAVRFSGPIAPPNLLAVGDALAIHDSTLGLDEINIETVKTGLNTGDKQCDVYVTTWKKHYVLDKVPVGQDILSTGIPRRFS